MYWGGREGERESAGFLQAALGLLDVQLSSLSTAWLGRAFAMKPAKSQLHASRGQASQKDAACSG